MAEKIEVGQDAQIGLIEGDEDGDSKNRVGMEGGTL